MKYLVIEPCKYLEAIRTGLGRIYYKGTSYYSAPEPEAHHGQL